MERKQSTRLKRGDDLLRPLSSVLMVSVPLVFFVRFEPAWPAIVVVAVYLRCWSYTFNFMDVASSIDYLFILMILLPFFFQ